MNHLCDRIQLGRNCNKGSNLVCGIQLWTGRAGPTGSPARRWGSPPARRGSRAPTSSQAKLSATNTTHEPMGLRNHVINVPLWMPEPAATRAINLGFKSPPAQTFNLILSWHAQLTTSSSWHHALVVNKFVQHFDRGCILIFVNFQKQ